MSVKTAIDIPAVIPSPPEEDKEFGEGGSNPATSRPFA